MSKNYMKSLLVTPIGLFLTLHSPYGALSAEWQTIFQEDQMTVFMDRASVHENQGQLKVWVMKDYRTTRFIGDDFYPHRSAWILYLLNCETHELGMMQWSLQSWNLGTGRTVWADQVQHVTYVDSRNDDVYRTLVDTACAVWRTVPSAMGSNPGAR
jgi:hypothetical protein